MAKQTDYSTLENEDLAKLVKMGRDTDGQIVLYLIDRNKPFSIRIWQQYRYSVPHEELPSIAYIAMSDACKVFEADRGALLLSVYGWYLKKELLRASGDNQSGFHVSKRVRDDVLTYKKAVTEFTQKHQREPTQRELIKLTGLTENELTEAETAYSALYPVYLDTPITTAESDGDCTIGDLVPDQTDTEQIITDKVYIEDLRKELRDIMTGALTREQRNAVDVRSYGVTDYAMLIGQTKNDVRRNYTAGLKVLRRPEHTRRLRGYLETDNLFTATGYSSFRRTGTSSPERITINRLDK